MASQYEDQNSNTNATGESSQNAQSGESTQSGATNQTKEEAGQELIDELTRLGQKFVEVVEVAWNSEQRKKIEEDLRTGLVTVANTLEDGFKRVSSSKEAQEAVRSAEDVAAKVRSSKVAVELTEALAQGLRTLSDQMDKLSEELKQKSATSKATGSDTSTGSSASAGGTQDIPIERADES
jgi:DNA polymerase III alpha subunit